MRKLVTAAAAAALCMVSTAPALAQNYRPVGFDAPRGAVATANLRVPLGREARGKASYGLTLGYGQATGIAADGRATTRELRIADLHFSSEGKVRNARLASFDLANLDRDRRRMNLAGGGLGTTWLILGVAVGAVGVCLLVDCFGSDDEADPN